MRYPKRSGPIWRGLASLAVLGWLGCAGSGTGCGALEPLPPTGYAGQKTDNAVNIRVSQNGLGYINDHWQTLLSTFAEGQKIKVPLGCVIQKVTGLSDVVFGDQGPPGCTQESCGRMNGKCEPNEAPVDLELTVNTFSLAARSPNLLEARMNVTVDMSRMYFDTVSRHALVCGVTISPLKCSVDFHTGAVAPATSNLSAQIGFTVDTRWDRLLGFEVTELGGTKVCGLGAPNSPDCLQPGDIDLNGENFCGGWCNGVDVDLVKRVIFGLFSPVIQQKISDVIATQACRTCGDGLPACPDLPGAQSSCDPARKVCVDDSTDKCVPRFLGVEGRLSPAALLAGYNIPAGAKLDMSVAAGSSVRADTGFTIGTRGGFASVGVADCVPPLPAPPVTNVPAPDFDTAASPGSAYHVGIGLAQPFLNLAFHQAHQSGALCLSLTSENVGLINTGLLKTFLPSLGKLATRDGRDAPMMVVLRPGKAPEVSVGEGTYDPVTKRPIKPLLTVALPQVRVDFYAMLDDRYVRLFSLTADLRLPLSVVFNGCSSVQPVLGDLTQLITNIGVSGSELLAEDPKVLTDLIPAVIGLAEPAIAQALSPFALPQLGSFKLKINDAKGVGRIAGSSAFHHLGLFAQLLPADAACVTSAPRVRASLRESRMPAATSMRLTGRGLPVPTAVLEVEAVGATGAAEFAFRVDQGLWSPFLPPNGGVLEVQHPAFLLQGQHVIQVRGRLAEVPNAFSAPTEVGFRVDWSPPDVQLRPDVSRARLDVLAHDAVSSDQALTFAYRVGDGAFSPFGPAREVDLAAVEAQGGVTVRVRDEAGNVAEATHRPPVTADAPGAAEVLAGRAEAPSTGCASAGSSLALVAWVSALTLARRRKATRA